MPILQLKVSERNTGTFFCFIKRKRQVKNYFQVMVPLPDNQHQGLHCANISLTLLTSLEVNAH